MVYALTVSISGCVQAKVKKIMAPMFTAGRIKSENAMQYMLPRWLICESRKNRSS